MKYHSLINSVQNYYFIWNYEIFSTMLLNMFFWHFAKNTLQFSILQTKISKKYVFRRVSKNNYETFLFARFEIFLYLCADFCIVSFTHHLIFTF